MIRLEIRPNILTILRFIDRFTWTITADGFDYKNDSKAIGCGNITNNSIPAKLALTVRTRCSKFNGSELPFTRDHGVLYTGDNPKYSENLKQYRHLEKTGKLRVGT